MANIQTQNQNNKEQSVLVLECVNPKDPGSEGDFLFHMLRLMKVKFDPKKISSRKELLFYLRESSHQNIHISTHGVIDEADTFYGLWTQDGTFKINHFAELQGKLLNKNVVVTACKAFDERFSKGFVDLTHCKNLIAPQKSVSFVSSIFFSHVYYHKYFIKNKDPKTIMDEYCETYKNPYKFSLQTFSDVKKRTYNFEN